MAKNKSMAYQVKKQLYDIQKFGHSRHEDKELGVSEKYIYSHQTMENYIKTCTRFAEWCKNEYGCKTLEECKEYAQTYIDSRNELSAYTISSDISGIKKLYNGKINLHKDKMRTRANIERSRVLSDRNLSEERKNSDLVDFIRSVGCRRCELIKITPNDIREVDGKVYVHLHGKGGKHRMAEVLSGKESIVLQYLNQEPDKPIFENPSNNLNIHHYRGDYAKALYQQIANSREMNNDKSNLYHCRGDMKGTTYYKDVMREVSQNLGHNRIDVIAQNYLYGME